MQLSMCEIEFNTKKKSRHNNMLNFPYIGLNNNYIQRYFLIHGLLNSMCSKHELGAERLYNITFKNICQQVF